MTNLIKHLNIIRTHRKFVREACFKMGLFWQGLVHDLSKYSVIELLICKYYSGTRSPHQNAREVLGYSPSWIHHYHTNKHHYQYWWDENEEGKIIPMKMPYQFVVESVADMLGASKAYNKENWKPEMLIQYWDEKCVGKRIMHQDSMLLVQTLLNKLVELGEQDFYNWYKNNKTNLQNNYYNIKQT